VGLMVCLKRCHLLKRVESECVNGWGLEMDTIKMRNRCCAGLMGQKVIGRGRLATLPIGLVRANMSL
jgi:hypothetical protein